MMAINQEPTSNEDALSSPESNPENLEDSSQKEPPQTSATTFDEPAFGWSGYAERVNGRFAMIGFFALLLIEALSSDTFLHWSGLIP